MFNVVTELFDYFQSAIILRLPLKRLRSSEICERIVKWEAKILVINNKQTIFDDKYI